ncbi:MAG: hypothetical protein QOE60_1093, partial [Thermoleophilaceae bacterium]|nr:hypothetical protein [Thermoleophilaceae bacterium]
GGGASAGDARAPMPGHVTPTESTTLTMVRADAGSTATRINPVGDVDPELYPTVHALAEGLAFDHYDDEFATGLENMLDRIEIHLRAT